MPSLTITNSQASLHDFFVRDLAGWLAHELGMRVEFVRDGAWDEREARLDAGTIDLGWVCGAPYVLKRDRGIPLAVLAAPVMRASQYRDRPVYFSNVIVRAESPYQTFEQLRGTRWVYNEPNSYSGYHVVRDYLARRGWDGDFFGEVTASGAHARSVEMILDNSADASAIDSTVLELLCETEPPLSDRIRIIESLGPGPMPPFVAGAHLAANLRARISSIMIEMHNRPRGRELLDKARMRRLARVTDSDYDMIRGQLEVARQIQF